MIRLCFWGMVLKIRLRQPKVIVHLERQADSYILDEAQEFPSYASV